LEQRLRLKGPQSPGGCVENPVSLRASKLSQTAPCRADPQSIFFSGVIRYFDELQLQPAKAAGSNCSGPPGRLAELPNDFAWDPDIIQQPIVQIA
jgi:hypothetical protein